MATLQELFVEYDKADAEWENKKTELEEAAKARSQIVKQIALEIAPKKRLVRKGREMSVVQRGETYFLRGSKNADAVEVD